MLIKKLSLSCLFVAMLFLVYGQESQENRVYYGGGAGFNGGTDFINISLSPIIGYKLTQPLSVGVGVNYQYVKFRQSDQSINNYGWNAFTRYNVTDQFFTLAEVERLNYEVFTFEGSERRGYTSLNAGIGFVERITDKTSFNIMALYNLLYDAAALNNPYNSPWIVRAGIGVGI